MAIVMPVLKDLMSSSTLGLGGLVASGMEVALYNWRMMAELTVDRAGLLACQDINVAITTLIKIAGLPHEYVNDAVIDDFMAQAREFNSDSLDGMDRAIQALSYTNNQISWAILRTHELLKWVDSGEYENVVQQKNVEIPETKEGWNFLTSW
jgi:hypothetical protein